MDLKSQRHWLVRVTGNAQPLVLAGSIRESIPKIIAFLMEARNGDFTIQCSRKQIAPDAVADLATGLMPEQTVTPEPDEGETYESYYARLLTHFDGADSMARHIANEWFDQPQLPWAGDERVARFIHMNASSRQADKADPQEYAALKDYVSRAYPDLFQTLVLHG